MNRSTLKEKRQKRCIFCSKIMCLIGFGLVVTAVGSYFFAQHMINNQIHQNIIINDGSKAFGYWNNPPAEIVRKYYLFDVRNPLEVAEGKEKPYVIQRGPYTYREVWEKKNVEFLGIEIVSYSPVVSIYFDPTLSDGSESDLITFLNIPAIGMIEQISHGETSLSVLAANALFAIYDTKLFVTKTVKELISGYKDPLLTLAEMFYPDLVKSDEFSLLNGKNGSEWQSFSMMTGYGSAKDVGKLVSWNGQEKLNLWDTESANLINGTDGTIYPPFIKRDEILYAFSPDMCRSYSIEYLKDNIVEGVHTYDFHLPKYTFYNSSFNPVSEGFCSKNCLGNGVMNISRCYGGVSGFISQPHFLNAEEKFTQEVDGLNPNEDLHDYILHFEPNTGVPISGNIRLQISFHVLHDERIDLVKNVKPVLIPIVWFDEDLEVHSDVRKQLAQVALIVQISNVLPVVILSLGGVLILISNFMAIYYSCIKKKKMVDDSKTSNEADETTNLVY